MAALTGNSVASSYQGLLKTSDNAAIDGTLKNMTDGDGNATPLSMANDYVQLQAQTIELIESTGGSNLMMISPTNVYFEGAVDFTNATVTGIGGGGGGITGASSTTIAAHNGPDTADVIYASLLIPANTFAAGDILQFNALADHDVTGGGWIYSSYWIHTNNVDVYGGAGFTQIQSPQDGTGNFYKALYVHTSDGSGSGTTANNSTNTDVAQPGIQGGDPYQTYAINWTVDQYINALVYVENAGSFISLKGMSISKINA
jgi:hypothetical protein